MSLVVMAQSVLVLSVVAQAEEPLPGAQAGNLYPLIRSTADRSTLPMSFLQPRFADVEDWRREVRPAVHALLHYDPPHCDPAPELLESVDCGEYVRERVEFSTTPDIRVPAYVLVPKDPPGPKPAVVALHDHGGFFVWGKEKIVDVQPEHPVLTQFKRDYYSGRSWASDLVRRGYVVVAIDMFYWGERRLLIDGDPVPYRDREAMSAEDIQAFNRRASEHTWLVGTGLFEAGASWAGVMFTDDIRTVDYLLTRPDVDADRIGCCGLSVGGFRSAHLAGLDPRIKTAVVVGWMCTYRDMLESHLTSIGPMKIVPGLYQLMDLPDVVSMTCPGALMVISGTQDGLFPLGGVQAAFDKIARVYAKAGVPERFEGVFYEGPHEFNAAMQERAFEWLDRWIGPGARR